ncbi:dynein light chain 1, cytoplasmic-like [Phalaenopsis equestris]|uniref:dynein light chain 1, cytoplasmic-like n=1 Tax=Phalaenopsis equestris TaxID=78828 RepID=UPI0009E59FD4|nr:dynein light chain 1, cytoplasmic-like [Phalaenopsis equestris]
MAEESRRAGGGIPGGGTLQQGGVRGSYYEEKKPALGADQEVARAKRVVLKSADMKEEVQKEAISCAVSAFDKHAVDKDRAEYIKKEFDKNHGPTWHCIVGRNFGSYVTHETNHFIYFYLDSKAVLLFKSG